MINGVINVYKEKGYTSHDVVAKLRGILKQKKIGHTGTLDPEAEGVLPVCLGSGTKLCDMLTDRTKEYVAEFLLGITTDTQDLTGKVISKREVRISEEEARKTIESFRGSYEQIPPMYSALKVNGKKLYELAREGKEIERKPRHVEIMELEILSMKLPLVRIRVKCSKGTYIRTLCHDIGEKLLCGGSMKSLIRTKAGSFELENAMKLAQIQEWKDAGMQEKIWISVEEIFEDLKPVHVYPEFTKMLQNGNQIFINQVVENLNLEKTGQIRMYDADEKFYGIYRFRKEKECFMPEKMFLN